MPRRSVPFSRPDRVLLALVAACLAVVAPQGRQQPLAPSALSPSDPYPNFDIRDYKQDPRLTGNAGVAAYMDALPTPPPAATDLLADGGSARLSLRDELPGIDVNVGRLGAAEIVSAMPGTPMLAPASGDRVATLRAFVRGHAPAYGISADQADQLVVVADEMNPAGNLAWVELEQRINGIPVFQGYLRGAFTPKGDLARTSGLLATGVTGALPTTPSLSAADAVGIAAASVQLPGGALVEKEQRDGRVVFERGALADEPRAWLVYYPLAAGQVRLAWVTEVSGDPLAFMIVVDAETGTVLFRKNQTEFQTQSASYNFYPSDSPAPASPSTALPGDGFNALLVPRVTEVIIGNEGPNSTFNNNGWITDGFNVTDGNNVEAGIDRDGVNGVDAPVTGSPNRVFTATYTPHSGSPGPYTDPLTVDYQRGEVINMFYWVNRYHDLMYRLGFTEAARNFQTTNFTGQGAGNDRISAETQDSSGTNNANFNTPADGARPRMQMYLWTGPTPDHGGGLDADVMIHELTHGLSNRLHGNASGLNTNMAGGLGEGWSDFYARALLSDASENVNGIYTLGGWATDELTSGFQSYYYGIRRFPYAVKTNVGANAKPHNPLTFADIDQTKADLSDGAFPFSTATGSPTRDQVHEAGQIWAMMLLEVRARFINRLGHATGNQRILQYVTDGMKLDAVGPTFLSARDSILAAANAGGATAADIADIWAGFATRGLGVMATIENAGISGGGTTRVTESYLRPGDPMPTFSVNDVTLAEGNAGTKTFAFSVSLANPTQGPSSVTYALANGTATGSAPAPVATSAGPINLPNGQPATTSGVAGPYPVAINVAGQTGTITKLAVRLNGLTHTFPGDLDFLLVGPGGQRAMFMSDLGGDGNVSNLTITFEDGAPAASNTQLAAGTFAPIDNTPGDAMNAPAPAGPYTSPLSAFNGTAPNGTWNLYIVDDTGVDVGTLTSVTLLMTTTTTVFDFVGVSPAVLSFPPGTTSQTVNVTVNGDTTVESPETFFLNLSNPVNAVVGDAQGVGTIVNDDGTVPAATNDAFATSFNTPLTVPAPGVLANDSANGLGALSGAFVTTPAHGSVTLAANGGFTYTPTSGYSGPDTFTYRAQAGGQLSEAATVSLTVNPATLQAPTGFYVASVIGSRAVFRWTPPAVGPAATGYIFEGGVAPGQVLASLPLGPVPILILDVPDGAFFVRVKALSGANVSAASNEVPLFVNVAPPPSAPANLTGLVNGSTLALTWRNTFGGGAPTGALLDVSGTFSGTLPLGPGESFTFPTVPAGSYTFQVRSTNAGGGGPASNPVTLNFPGGCTGAPQPPTRFLAFAAGSTLTILWESPAAGAAATGYTLHATGTVVNASVPMGMTNSLSVPVPPGTYNLSVSAVNACGSSAPTAVQSVTVP